MITTRTMGMMSIPAIKYYAKKNIPNPFYDYRDDGFLFIIHFGDDEAGEAVPEGGQAIAIC